jgi:parvulin-like peptidyl-prolyl isomerase
MKLKLVVAVLTVTLAGAACGDLLAPAAATVNGDKITIDEVETVVDRFRESPAFEQAAQTEEPGVVAREFEQSYLSRLIRREVLEAEARRLGVEVTDQDVSDRLDQITADLEAQGQSLEDLMAQQGLTQALVRAFVADDELERRLRAKVTEEVQPTEDELRAAYKQRMEEFTETRVAHILVTKRGLALRMVGQLRTVESARGKKADARLEDLFAKLAEKHSEDPGSADKGGELGYFKPGDFPAPFEEAAAELEVGEISDPVKTEFGFHVIWVKDRRTAPIEQVRAQIREQISGPQSERFWNEWLEDAFRSADVEVNPRYGEFDPVTGRIDDPGPDSIPGGATPDATPEPSPTLSPPSSPGGG